MVAAAVLLGTVSPVELVGASPYEGAVEITLPVEGAYSDDYDVGRAGGRVHRATDIFNEMWTEVHAAMSGTVTWAPTAEHATAGFGLQIEGDDGRTYAYYHLGEADGARADALAEGVDLGARVERGQLIGYLGNSGNARHTPPHLHFEIHEPGVTDPYGSDRLNPYGSLRAAEARGDLPDGAVPSSPPQAGPGGWYTVQAGDTLSGIARDHGLDGWDELSALNPDLEDPHLIVPGQLLRTPVGELHIVEEGDTLSDVARAYGFDSWEILLELNPEIDDPHLILPGQQLKTAQRAGVAR